MTGHWPYPKFIAHRCGGRHAPENTLAGLFEAARHGFSMVEFDVMLAACGTPVLIHDETLERTTDGRGRVCDTTFQQLRKLDAGILHPAFSGERIPSLHQALDRADALGLKVNVEIKPATGFDEVTAEVVADVLGARVIGGAPPLVSSFSPAALRVLQQRTPSIPRGMLFEQIPADWHEHIRALAAVSIHCHAGQLTPDTLQTCLATSLPVLCYTVNDPAQAEALFDSGVSGIFTDSLLPA